MTTLTKIEMPPFLPPWADFERAMTVDRLIRGTRRGPLLILNYNQKAGYDRRWELPAVRAARGLVNYWMGGQGVPCYECGARSYAQGVADGAAAPDNIAAFYTRTSLWFVGYAAGLAASVLARMIGVPRGS